MLAVGAVINYFTFDPKESLESGLLWSCIMLGVLMTLLVLFILSIFGSTLIADSEGNRVNPLNHVATCLAAAIRPHFARQPAQQRA